MMVANVWRNLQQVAVIILVVVSSSPIACGIRSGPVVEPSPSAASPTGTSGSQIAGSAIKATFQMLTDHSSDKGAVWVTNDIIRFVRDVDYQWSIGELQLSTGKVDLRLTGIRTPSKGVGFYWSASGNYLAIRHFYDNPGLWLYNARTGKVSSISPLGVNTSTVVDVAWMPEESSMFVLTSREEAPVEGDAGYLARIVHIDRQTLSSTTVTDLPRGHWFQLALSPASDVMLVSRGRFPSSPNSPSLYKIDIASGRLEESTLLGSAPRWSPDGSLIAYRLDRTIDRAQDVGVWIAPSSLTGARRLIDFQSMRWLPDGKHLLLSNLSVVDVHSGQSKKLEFEGEKPSYPLREMGPVSPDGKKVVWDSYNGLGVITLGE